MNNWAIVLGLWISAFGLGGLLISRDLIRRIGNIAAACLCGVVMQSALAGLMAWGGLSFATIYWILLTTGLAAFLIELPELIRTIGHLKNWRPHQLHWYEWLLVVCVCECCLFSIWQISNVPMSSEDAIFHWSGRGRLLFGEVNWSWDADQPQFLGLVTWNRHYPLLIPLLRSTTAGGHGAWTSVAARADGLLFYLCLLGGVWSLTQTITQSRPWAAVATFLCLSQPLLTWHASAGNADIAVAAFFCVAMFLLQEQKWTAAGVLAAGTVLTKNEGLVLYLPAILLATAAPSAVSHDATEPSRIVRVRTFLLGLLWCSPWILFRTLHQFPISPSGEKPGFHPQAIPEFIQALWINPTSFVLWPVAILTLCWTGRAMWETPPGKQLLTALGLLLTGIVAVFTMTEAAKWLNDEVTLHRILMQLSGVTISAMCAGLALGESMPKVAAKTPPIQR